MIYKQYLSYASKKTYEDIQENKKVNRSLKYNILHSFSLFENYFILSIETYFIN